MKFLKRGKDGGPKSTVTGYWLAEIKSLFSAVVLKFEDGSRDEYHDHAFNSISWVLGGSLIERHLDGKVEIHKPSWLPVITRRDTFHNVVSQGTTWVFSIRGPWAKTWREWDPKSGFFTMLSHGRKIV